MVKARPLRLRSMSQGANSSKWDSAAAVLSSLLLSVFCAVCLSCRSGQRPKVIAVIESTGGTSFWTTFGRSAAERAERYGFHLQIFDPQSPADYEAQAHLLNEAIQRHVDGIILAPSHQLVLAEGVRRAHAASIPVVIVDTPIAVQPSEYVVSIGCGNDAIGFMAAQHFIHDGVPESRILVVGASPTLQATTQREEAMRRVLQRFSSQQIVDSRYSLSDWARARQTTLDALEADPKINGIFSSDEFSTHGVLNALRSMKHRPALTLVGVDNDAEAQQAVRTGLMSMTIACDSSTIAELAVDAMRDALQQRPVEKLIQTEALAVTRENIDSFAARRMLQ